MESANDNATPATTLRIVVVCDGCNGYGEIRARSFGNPEHAACDLEECPDCRGACERVTEVDACDPWALLRALRARPLVHATADDIDAEINGGAAVDELCTIRSLIDAALAAKGQGR